MAGEPLAEAFVRITADASGLEAAVLAAAAAMEATAAEALTEALTLAFAAAGEEIVTGVEAMFRDLGIISGEAFAASFGTSIQEGVGEALSSLDALGADVDAELGAAGAIGGAEFANALLVAIDEAVAEITGTMAGLATAVVEDMTVAGDEGGAALDAGLTRGSQRASRQAALDAGLFGTAWHSGFLLAELGAAEMTVKMGHFAYQTSSDIQQATNSFQLLTGSLQTAQGLIAGLQQMAINSPFQFTQLTDVTDRVLSLDNALGISQKNALDWTAALGNAVALTNGGTTQLHNLGLAFGEIASTGYLSQQQLRRVEIALPGMNVQLALANQLGMSTADMQKAIHDKAIDAQTGIQALIQAMQQYPNAANAMKAHTDTLVGAFTSMKDQLQILLYKGMQPALPQLATLMRGISVEAGPAILNMGTAFGVFLPQAFQAALAAFQGFSAAVGPFLVQLGPILVALGPALTQLGAGFGELFTKLGPVVLQVVQALMPGLMALMPVLPQLADSIVAIAPALVVIATALSEILKFLQPIMPLLLGLWGVLKVVVLLRYAWLALSALFATTPIGLIITAIVIAVYALIKGFQYLFEHNKKFHDFIVNSWGNIIKFFKEAWRWIQQIGEAIATFAVEAWSKAVVFFDKFIGFFTSLPGKAGGALDAVGGFFTRLGSSIKNGFDSAVGSVENFFTALPGKVGHVLAQVPGLIAQAIKDIINGVTFAIFFAIGAAIAATTEIAYKAFQIVRDDVPKWFGQLIDAIKNAWSSAIDGIRTGWDNAIQGIIDGWNAFYAFITALPGKMYNWAVDLTKQIGTALKNGWDAIYRDVGNWWDNTVEFFKKLPGEVVHWVSQMASDAKSAFLNFWDGSLTWAKNGVQSIVDEVKKLPGQLKNLGSDFLEAGKHMIQSLWNGLKDVGTTINDFGKAVVNGIVDFINRNVIGGINSGLSHVSLFGQSPFGDDFLPPLKGWQADGNIFASPSIIGVGEAGPEVVIPLSRPQRAMELAKQSGLLEMLNRNGGGQQVNAPITVNTVGADPYLVALKVQSRLARMVV